MERSDSRCTPALWVVSRTLIGAPAPGISSPATARPAIVHLPILTRARPAPRSRTGSLREIPQLATVGLTDRLDWLTGQPTSLLSPFRALGDKSMDDQDRHQSRIAAFTAIGAVGAVVGAAAAVAAVFVQSTTNVDLAIPLPTATHTQTVTASATVTAPPSNSSEPNGSTRRTPGSGQLYRLSDLWPVYSEKEGRPGSCTHNCTGFDPGAARVGGDVYPNSWLMQIDGDGRRGTMQWNPAGACESIRGHVGLTDDSLPTEVTFTIEATLIGGSQAETSRLGTSTTGQLDEFDIDLGDVATFTIAAYVSGREVDDAQVALADVELMCRPGSMDSD